jgi:hypothetical protein
MITKVITNTRRISARNGLLECAKDRDTVPPLPKGALVPATIPATDEASMTATGTSIDER